MKSLPTYSIKLKDKVLLIGFDTNGKCVYSAFLTVHAYYDGDHPWDDGEEIKSFKLRTVHGYIFGESGNLEQEFESQFNIDTGMFEKGWSRDEDGVLSEA